MTELSILPISEAALLPEALCEELFPLRMKRARQYRLREDALRSVAAGALLALVLGAKETDLRRDAHGKPLWTRGERFFSLSRQSGTATSRNPPTRKPSRSVRSTRMSRLSRFRSTGGPPNCQISSSPAKMP